MLLGKRPPPPIKRTTSMTDIRMDLSDLEAQEPSDHRDLIEIQDVHAMVVDDVHVNPSEGRIGQNTMATMMMSSPDYSALLSPRNHKIIETPQFLRTCGLCERHLAPARDIYMYKGETGFCSLECREQQMKKDEIKDKCTNRHGPYSSTSSSSSSSSSSRGSRKNQTLAAA